MENRDIVYTGKGIRVGVLSVVFIAIGVLTMIASIFLIKRIYVKFDGMMNFYNFAEMEREASAGFKAASDYLTDQARQFAVNGDISNVENYFFEKDINKRREAALEVIENSNILELEGNLLHSAMELSEGLVELEIHAMKLVATAEKIDAAKLPAMVVSYKLPDDELKLSAGEMKNLAIQLLYSTEYEASKAKINWDTESAIILIKDEAGTSYREEEADLILVLNLAAMFIFIMFILLMLIFIFNTLLVVRPARRFMEFLDKQEKLPVIGGFEFRRFAEKYNDVYRTNRKNRELLREQGEVDELTGTLKVSTLEFVKHNLSQSEDPLGIMLVDIDNFRTIKESSGYDMADKVVAKVAKLFTETFKGSDYIIRISQDEFELFMLRMKQEDSELLTGKIEEINRKLQDTEDGVIAASVSVGVSFSESGYNAETERKADMALNYVKENGRGTCKIS